MTNLTTPKREATLPCIMIFFNNCVDVDTAHQNNSKLSNSRPGLRLLKRT